MRYGLASLKCSLSSMQAFLAVDKGQSPQTIVIGHISNVTREASKEGLDIVANF